MAQHNAPSHSITDRKGEEIASTDHSGRDGETRNLRDATSINPDKRRPIAPGMPLLPPA
ncbi:MAG TPA: hypothetical protein VHX14_05665 [Thermoanaerobaculia bacterium]|jgi:hypothetical protein|nr:hypothetical protein [Thermoanaerobaculia bacterium]